jgi:hypothetical protein
MPSFSEVNGLLFDLPPDWTVDGSSFRAPGDLSRLATITFHPPKRLLDPKTALDEWTRLANEGYVEEHRERVFLLEGSDGIQIAMQHFVLGDPRAVAERRPPRQHRIYFAYAKSGGAPMLASYVCLVTKLHETVVEDVVDCLSRPRLAAPDLRTLIKLGKREMIAKSKIWASLEDPRGRWDADLELGNIWITDRHGVVTVRGQFEIIGSFSTTAKTWQWGWASERFPEELTKRVRTVYELGKEIGEEYLTEPRLPADEYFAEDLAAIAIRVTGAKAWYRVQLNATTVTYLLITEIYKVAAAA